MRYPLQFHKDDEGFLITSPDFPEVVSKAMDVDEAKTYGAGAIEEAIAARMATGRPIPMPSVFVANVKISEDLRDVIHHYNKGLKNE